MNWEAIGAIGEILGAVAVVATLGYLAVQIRGSTKATRAGTSLSINDALSKILSALRSDGEFAEIWYRGLQNLGSLNEVEAVRFESHALDMLNLAEFVHQL